MRLFQHSVLIAALLLAFTYSSLGVASTQTCESNASLKRIKGQVQLVKAGSPFPLRNPELPYALCAGDKIQTVAKAQALIVHVSGEVVLAENSRLEVLDVNSLSLAEGVALFQITQREGQRFIAHTPLVVIGVKGTQFLVSSQAERNDVALFKGSVGVERQDGQEMAYFRSKPVAEMSYKEYSAYQKKSFSEYKNALKQAFNDYKKQQMAEFQAYVSSVDLQTGRQLTLSGAGALNSKEALSADGSVSTEAVKPEAVDAPVTKAVEKLHQQLKVWL